MKRKGFLTAAGFLAALAMLFTADATAAQRFSDQVGRVKVGPVKSTSPLQVPFITWGGDMATFYANGGLTTKNGSIFHQQGLNLKLQAGDDFHQQVRDYLSGKSPFLRGTFRMIGLAAEMIDRDPRTKGVVILQLTWSQGDHMVARRNIRTLADLKGKTIVLQKGGPHVGMLYDVLKTAGLGLNDVKLIWADDLTGTANCPSEMFKKNKRIDAAFVITPDMIGLTGGAQNVGSGAEGTVKGAHVLVSTAELSRSIADVYVVRQDFYDNHRDLVTKFVAGYLKAAEEVVEQKKQYESRGSRQFEKLLKLTQEIYGRGTIPTLEEAHGLISDCKFVGHAGNVSFFTDSSNLRGFDAFKKSSLQMAVDWGFARSKGDLKATGIDWNSSAYTGYLAHVGAARSQKFRPEAVQSEIEELSSGGVLDDNTIYSFTINFEPNQNDFSASKYRKDFDKVIELSQMYGGAVIAIRGHSDPTKTLVEMVRAGLRKGTLKQSGSGGQYVYYYNGRQLDLNSTEGVIKLIQSGAFDGVTEHNPRDTMQAAANLSRIRARAVRESLIEYARHKKVTIDESQIQPQGVGIREPLIAKPANMGEAKRNMRVEFRIVRVSAEAIKASDFDF
ncbi:hypothetical protein AMJ57_00535 [Parcubacteria bacterium SG8_24]|nr:MAG: hypothetical protein AMJ57_00535 [Parcubacteria bacterium SG8_24]